MNCAFDGAASLVPGSRLGGAMASNGRAAAKAAAAVRRPCMAAYVRFGDEDLPCNLFKDFLYLAMVRQHRGRGK